MKKFYKAVFVILLFSYGCKQETTQEEVKPIVEKQVISSEVADKWAEITLKTIYKAPSNSPTYCSRALGYLGLAMYESVVHGSSEHQSIAWQLNGLHYLPFPEANKKYIWQLSLNASQAMLLKLLYEQVEPAKLQAIDLLEKEILEQYSKGEAQDAIDRSVNYGKAIANRIYNEWGINDGGHQGYKRSFVTDYMLPNTIGTWQPPIIGQTSSRLPLHPYWGKNRTFSVENGQLPVPKMIEYNRSMTSDYFKQHLEVYQKSQSLTQTEKEIALWWGDDPSETYSPPGHSYYLGYIAVKTSKADLFKATETYARVGMAVADAFINCWKAKYTYHCERPTTYIRANMDFSWLPFWPEPPFPSFSSGHATQGAAAATVLTSIYGNNFKFTDDTHAGRPKDLERNVEYKARTFNSFQETAEESAMSRLYGGIHCRQDNETGLIEGKKIGENINKLKWKK